MGLPALRTQGGFLPPPKGDMLLMAGEGPSLIASATSCVCCWLSFGISHSGAAMDAPLGAATFEVRFRAVRMMDSLVGAVFFLSRG